MPVRVPGGHVFEPEDLALLRRAFALATADDGPAASSWRRELAARRLFAEVAAGERDARVLVDRARLIVHSRTVVRFPSRRDGPPA